jgi:hypothetical protein
VLCYCTYASGQCCLLASNLCTMPQTSKRRAMHSIYVKATYNRYTYSTVLVMLFFLQCSMYIRRGTASHTAPHQKGSEHRSPARLSIAHDQNIYCTVANGGWSWTLNSPSQPRRLQVPIDVKVCQHVTCCMHRLYKIFYLSGNEF